MSAVAAAASGKSDKDENFPVAALLAPRYRAPVLAFYNFVRAADDVADHATLAPERKLALLDALGRALTGDGPPEPVAEPLRHSLLETGVTPRHALDLLDAFRLDATKKRYADFNDLIAYCRLSAMPVGRYVLDLHGEDRATWAASDKLCAALQIINHLQDCGKDFRDLDRVYLPGDILAAHDARVEMLGEPRAPGPLRGAIIDIAQRTQKLLDESAAFPSQVRNLRLAMNVAAIQRLAERLTQGLLVRDPLSQKVHASKASFVITAALAASATALARANPFRARG
ncbi:MAG: squalene synthase HpnC [Hyphomicrobiales bacterium]|nr:squalene synthase HpnC [Hyphomicrobiales bacterium]